MGATKKTNLTISEIDEEEENKNRNRKKVLSQIKSKGRIVVNRKIKEILGKQYKILLDDPLNPYGTFWPSNFLKAGYGTGFEYEYFQAGVPVLKLKNLGKKQLPPIKKKALHFNAYSPNRNIRINYPYPATSVKKLFNEENYDSSRTNKSEHIKIFNIKLNSPEETKKFKFVSDNQIQN